MLKIQEQYELSQARYLERFNLSLDETGVNIENEVNKLSNRFGISQKKRRVSEYMDIASYLLYNYSFEVAYFLTVEINEQFESQLGYPPIGQIMLAMEKHESEAAAHWIGCAILNFPRVETAQLAFGTVKSTNMRSRVKANLAAENKDLADYIASSEIVSPTPMTEVSSERKVEDQTGLSDGMERMPRSLTDAEISGDKLFYHLQVVSSVLLFSSPVLGGVLGEWVGAAVGLLIGLLIWIWMRRSMGIRGSNPQDGFIIRMKERANGSRCGILEALIEKVRQRSFTREQCVEITEVWGEMLEELEKTTSEEEKREIIKIYDEQIKRISYGQNQL